MINVLVLREQSVPVPAQQELASSSALLYLKCSSSGTVEKPRLCAQAQPPSAALGRRNSCYTMERSARNECDVGTISGCQVDDFDVDGVDELFERSCPCDQ